MSFVDIYDSSTVVLNHSNPITFIIDSLEFSYYIRNNNGDYTTSINENEAFQVYFTLKNKKKNAIVIPIEKNYVGYSFIQCYDSKDVTYIFNEGDTTLVLQKPYILYPENEYRLGYANSGTIKPRVIPKGNYYIEYKHPHFVFFDINSFNFQDYASNKIESEVIISNFPRCRIYFKIY